MHEYKNQKKVDIEEDLKSDMKLNGQYSRGRADDNAETISKRLESKLCFHILRAVL